MIQFFKSQILMTIDEEYSDVLDQIKLLKENYMLVKDNLDTPAQFFREIATSLHAQLDRSEAVQVALGYMPEEKRADFLEDFTDA